MKQALFTFEKNATKTFAEPIKRGGKREGAGRKRIVVDDSSYRPTANKRNHGGKRNHSGRKKTRVDHPESLRVNDLIIPVAVAPTDTSQPEITIIEVENELDVNDHHELESEFDHDFEHEFDYDPDFDDNFSENEPEDPEEVDEFDDDDEDEGDQDREFARARVQWHQTNPIVYRSSMEILDNYRKSDKKGMKKGFPYFNMESPSVKFCNSLCSQGPNPEVFYKKKVFIWEPHVLFPMLKIKCFKCEKASTVVETTTHSLKSLIRLKSWTAPRIVYGEDDIIICFSRIYECSNCDSKIVSSKRNVLNSFPYYVKEAFPFILTKRNGILKSIVSRLISSLEFSTGPAAFRSMLKEGITSFHIAYSIKYEQIRITYYSAIKSELFIQNQGGIFRPYKLANILNQIPTFSEFKDPTGYLGKIPSQTYLTSLVIAEYGRKSKYLDIEMQRRNSPFLYFDHSHKITKHIQYYGDTKLYNGLFSGVNGYGEVRALQFVQSTSYDEVQESLKELYKTSSIYGIQPAYTYTDKCCSDRGSLEAALPSLKKGTHSLLPLPLPGNTQQVNNHNDINCSLEWLLNILDSRTDSIPIGLDAEWPVDMDNNHGARRQKIACIQVAIYFDQPMVLVITTHQWTNVPTSLKLILESKKVLKYGRRIFNDAKYLEQDWEINIPKESLVELYTLYKARYPEETKTGLDVMSEKVLNYTLYKGNDVRVTNEWSKAKLSKSLFEYAARDAWASLLIGLKLNGSPITDVYLNTDLSSSSSDNSTSGDLETPNLTRSNVRLDPFHAMKRIGDTVSTKHPYTPVLMAAIRDAMFVLDEGDKVKVEKVLKDNFQTTFESKLLNDPDWIFKRVRRHIPQKEILYERLETVIKNYSHKRYKDSKYGDLLRPEVKSEFKNLLQMHVKEGCLSDPPGVSLYMKRGKDRNDLPVYRCLRGTNTVELWHQFIEMRFASWNAGPQFALAAMMFLVDRRNKRASARNRPNFPDIGHYEHYLLDDLQELHVDLFGKTLFNWWPLISKLPYTSERFGMVPSVPTELQENVTLDDVRGYTNTMKFIAMKTKCKVPLIGISGRAEKSLYMKAIPFYSSNGKLTDASAQKMARDWNFGILQTSNPSNITSPVNVPVGINGIWRKLGYHLQTYYKIYMKALDRKQLVRLMNQENTITEVDEQIELEQLDVVDPEDIPVPNPIDCIPEVEQQIWQATLVHDHTPILETSASVSSTVTQTSCKVCNKLKQILIMNYSLIPDAKDCPGKSKYYKCTSLALYVKSIEIKLVQNSTNAVDISRNIPSTTVNRATISFSEYVETIMNELIKSIGKLCPKRERIINLLQHGRFFVNNERHPPLPHQ